MGKKREGIMLCYPFEERRFERWGTWALAQPKLDGYRCRALLKDTGVELLSSTEEPIVLPHIEEALNSLIFRLTSCGIFELDGEIYKHGLPFQHIRRKTNSDRLEYHVFDHVSQMPCCDRLWDLESLDLSEDLPIKIIKSHRVDTVEQIASSLAAYYTAGYEGIVIRHPSAMYERKRSTGIMKFKPHQNDVYEVVGFEEEISITGQPKGSLGALVCKDDDGETFSVGTGFTRVDRERLWAERYSLIGLLVEIKYQALTERGVPRFGIFLRLWRV